jgi:hypothetical protein
MERFVIHESMGPVPLLDASTMHKGGGPGNWHALGVPENAQVVAVTTLPMGPPVPGSHDAFRLLISYRLPEPEPDRAMLPIDWHSMLDARGRPVDGTGRLLPPQRGRCGECGRPVAGR